MPHMTGEALARALHKIRSEIPIILCTGFSDALTAEKVAAVGIRAYLMKPLVSRELGLADTSATRTVAIASLVVIDDLSFTVDLGKVLG